MKVTLRVSPKRSLMTRVYCTPDLCSRFISSSLQANYGTTMLEFRGNKKKGDGCDLDAIDTVRNFTEVANACSLLAGIERAVICPNDLKDLPSQSLPNLLLMFLIPDRRTHYKLRSYLYPTTTVTTSHLKPRVVYK